MNVTLIVYNDTGNPEDYALLTDGVVVPDLTSITRMTIKVGERVVDSDQDAGVFDWSGLVTAAEAALHSEVSTGDPKIIITMGHLGLAAGTYSSSPFKTYSPDYPLGLYWGCFDVVVVDL